jgi:hypothetical protein
VLGENGGLGVCGDAREVVGASQLTVGEHYEGGTPCTTRCTTQGGLFPPVAPGVEIR